jgi:hypothetical protein
MLVTPLYTKFRVQSFLTFVNRPIETPRAESERSTSPIPEEILSRLTHEYDNQYSRSLVIVKCDIYKRKCSIPHRYRFVVGDSTVTASSVPKSVTPAPDDSNRHQSETCFCSFSFFLRTVLFSFLLVLLDV